ncbi:MAG: hypothetical protein EZS28_046013, partial [Streblomastix strix]
MERRGSIPKSKARLRPTRAGAHFLPRISQENSKQRSARVVNALILQEIGAINPRPDQQYECTHALVAVEITQQWGIDRWKAVNFLQICKFTLNVSCARRLALKRDEKILPPLQVLPLQT